MALRAAMTGHQVFSTLHTNDAFGSINRLVDLGLRPSMLASHLLAIVAQRLIRKLCPSCKVRRKMTPHEASLLKLSSPQSLCVAKGCESCRGTGYRGRFAIAEILGFDQDLDECLVAFTSAHQMKALAERKGFVSLSQDAQHRVLKGDTTVEEILRVVSL